MDTRRVPLVPDRVYHIYNRGINGQNVFFEEKNYGYFLERYALYAHPVVETFAYCLLKNHFHILARVKPEAQIRAHLNGKKEEKSATWHVSNAFSSLFQSYSQSINSMYSRTGKLFEMPFHRIHVDNEAYFSHLIWYIHHNPQKHGFINDFRDYPYSSYHAHLKAAPTKLERQVVLDWFGGKEHYVGFHQSQHDEKPFQAYVIEF